LPALLRATRKGKIRSAATINIDNGDVFEVLVENFFVREIDSEVQIR
jgi:hypothetical protein